MSGASVKIGLTCVYTLEPDSCVADELGVLELKNRLLDCDTNSCGLKFIIVWIFYKFLCEITSSAHVRLDMTSLDCLC